MPTIITPTDFSDVSLNAANYAADMALALNARLLIIHATELPMNPNDVYTETKKEDNKIAKRLDTVREALVKRTGAKIRVESKHVIGFIENEIIKMCDYQNPLAIVMATQGASIKDHFFMGSITVHLSKNLKYPVIVVPQGLSYKSINKVLLATDLENLYDLPIEKIINITKALNATLDIVHVYKSEDKFEVMATRISELTNYLKSLNPQFHFIRGNNVYKAVTDFARTNHSNLIITFPKKHAFFHKSESKQLIFNAPFAVMTIQ